MDVLDTLTELLKQEASQSEVFQTPCCFDYVKEVSVFGKFHGKIGCVFLNR